MPKYRIALANGKSLVFEGDQPPTDQDIEQGAQEAGVRTLLMNPRQGEPDRNVDAQSWRHGADPEGAMALAGIAQEHPKAAVGGALAGAASAVAAPFVAPAVPGLLKDAAVGGVVGGAEGFARSKGDLGQTARDALIGAVSGPILKRATGAIVGNLAEKAGKGWATGTGALRTASQAAPETVNQTVGRLRGVAPDIAGPQWEEAAFNNLIAKVGLKEALRQYGIGQFGKDASQIVLK